MADVLYPNGQILAIQILGTSSGVPRNVLYPNGQIMGVQVFGSTGGGGGSVQFSAGTLSSLRSDITFGDSNGISFGLQTNGVITGTVATNYQSSGAYLTTAALSQDSSKYAGIGESTGTIAGTNLGLTVNTVGVSIVYPNWLTTAMQSNAATLSNIAVSAGITSNLLSAITFSNSNNVSFGLNASVITATATVASSQGSINLSAGATSNVGSVFVFSNSNNVSFGLTGSTITATATVASSQGSIKISAGTTSNLLSAFTFADGSGVSWGINASTITATVKTDYLTAVTNSQSFGASNLGNVTGTTGIASGGQVRAIVVGGNNVTISQSVNGASVTQSIAAGGTHSFYPFAAQVGQSGAVQIGNSTLMMFPLCVKEFVSLSRVQHYISVSHSSSGDTRTLRLTLGASIGIYTRNASTFNNASSTTGNWNITISSQDSTASFSGLRFMTFALNASLTPGDYWVAFVSTTDSARQAGGGNAMTFSNIADLAMPSIATSMGMFSAALNASNQFQFGKGVYSVATNGLPAAIQASELTASASNARVPYLYGVNLSQ